ncbi:hypothetical protein BX616_004310 [Lobosporangium transversale]|uniref:Uncharacterized protein n=1 Tax=Lobosporangium transversale TaxID=64571 RepID=A0A1Y2H1K5_9FUNG|nr:hypothetical protein BCR41DRAFT_383594 [Lobosporangium transversale]KAF9898236.1 hypothetical protein BX616_004310 [Lobosporangium transversale]ORZ27924.1 hypothetical protein BCR41DRAFT_383594 [Lobosporangium transversale]|eukprot:XP_021885627.1 hypothetical protein BCR41DRAFT_383594 [Lobosporangium transversale]
MPKEASKEKGAQASGSKGSQPRSVKKNERWSDAFMGITGSDYFSSLKDPSSINHIEYFRHCKPNHYQKAHYHNLWGHDILSIIEHSPIQRLSEQHKRLKREWSETGATENFWEQVLTEELSRRDELNHKRQLVAVRENAVDQLEDTYQFYSKRTRLSNVRNLGNVGDENQETAESDISGSEEGEVGFSFQSLDLPHNIGELELPSSDPFDSSLHSDCFSDGTLEDSPPVGICRLVGPGTRTSELSGDSLYYKDGMCVSTMLMSYRRRQVEDESFLQDFQIKEILSLNFVFFDPLIHNLQDEQLAQWRRALGDSDKAFIVGLAEACCQQGREEALRTLYSLGVKLDLITSPLFLAAQSLMSTSVLWADTVLVRDNEDSFIERFLKPLMNAFFGQFTEARLCWTRNTLKTGHIGEGELLYPDVMLSTTSTPQHTVLVGEVKKMDGSDHEYDRDRVKLFIEMKRCLDGLLDCGVDGPVVGILAQGHRVEVWNMTLPYEALYVPTLLGSFDLILSRYYFGAFFALAPPLLAAKAVIQDTLTRLRQGQRRSSLKSGWRRGTYHYEPLILKQDVSIVQEVRELKKENKNSCK